MDQEEKKFVCKLCGKTITVLKEGKNPNPPTCCGQTMESEK